MTEDERRNRNPGVEIERTTLEAIERGQLWLWPEVQWEPFAPWMLPRGARVTDADRQGGLFLGWTR